MLLSTEEAEFSSATLNFDVFFVKALFATALCYGTK